MTTPSGGSPDDETWRRPQQPATAGENASGAVPPEADGPSGPGSRPGGAGRDHDPDRTGVPAGTTGQPDPGTPAADPTAAGRIHTAGTDAGDADTPEAAGNASPWSREAATDSPWARSEAAGGWTVAGGAWPGPPGGGTPASGYAGPPPSTPPPPGWRPPVHVQPSPPRRLPPQDMAAMDQAEQRAQRLTYGIGAAVAVVLVLLTCLLCSRVLF
ncbi:hypothetical protein [Micromonospora sp. CNB394]|uniref:hypothetical protein n=1 Tax=Micromonospora sp. CNB394 TaxID=1169151 RepID=UPI0018C910FC|nr:hypothetical protein [Micromonospora sp. CNB394]